MTARLTTDTSNTKRDDPQSGALNLDLTNSEGDGITIYTHAGYRGRRGTDSGRKPSLNLEETVNTSTLLKVVGIILICVAIHFGLSQILPLIVFGAGLGFLFLP